MRETYESASLTRLGRIEAEALFDRLFPVADEDAAGRAKTIAENRRTDARAAMALDVNNEGPTVATLWNAATYIVDRKPDGTARPIRGGEALDSLLFGTRGKRIAEVQSLIEVVMADGSLQRMSVPEARGHGLDDSQCGASILADMLDGGSPTQPAPVD